MKDLRESNGCEISPSFNEEIAYSIAHGSGILGKRSLTLMKTHGLAKAGNAVIDSLYAGTTAGFVTMIFDDSGKHSESIIDPVSLLEGLGIPHIIGESGSINRALAKCFETSERFQIPYALLVRSDDINEETPAMAKGMSGEYVRNVTQHVLCPPFSEYTKEVLERKMRGNRWEDVKKPSIKSVYDIIPHQWRDQFAIYSEIFDIFKRFRGEIVTGDTGMSSLFALPPYDCIDVTSHLGGSIPLAIGAYLAGRRNVWAVTGDFSLIGAGYMGLLEAIQRKIPLKVLILYNGIAATTGGDRIASGLLKKLLEGYKNNLRMIEIHEAEKALEAASTTDELSLIAVDCRIKDH
jgi:TPP-dependent indolepyruvate ferredoxin oxidoreductase alpha subunit